jgi:TonB-linked SusC/RagA family outer membrane protein
VLSYQDQIGAHRFSVMLGQSTRMYYSGWETGRVYDVPNYSEASKYLSTGSYKNQYVTDGATRYNGVSAFMRASYNYHDRYLATVTFRADGSSKYQQKWGFFPSVGIGWNITQEEFMKDQHAFDNLKLRASWGLLGNDNIPANSTQILGVTGIAASAVFGDKLVDGIAAQTVLQNYLKWEVVNETNVGIDFSTLHNRLTGELDFFYRNTENVVFYVPIASGGGTAELLANNGTVNNTGVELSLNWSDKVGDFHYNLGLNATYINNKVLKLEGREFIPGAAINGDYATRTQVGLPIGAFWGYEVEGVYATEIEALKDPVSQTIKDAGYFKYKDQNGDKVIDEKDKVYLGSAIPPVMLGFNFGFDIKGFDFSISFASNIGHKILNQKRMNRNVFPESNYDLDYYEHAWRPTNTNTDYPSPEAFNSSYTMQCNSFYVEDGSFIRIQNVQLGYNVTQIPHVKNLRVYLSAQNPFSYFRYNGFTTEIGGSPITAGVDNSVYPSAATYTLGLNINF